MRENRTLERTIRRYPIVPILKTSITLAAILGATPHALAQRAGPASLTARSDASRAAPHYRKPAVRFRANGTLRIVQFTDAHNGKSLDPRVAADMGRLLDREKPDFVILTGDNCTDDCDTPEQLRASVRSLAEPMESRRIPWAAVLGNHDAERIARLGLAQPAAMEMYRSLPYNVNPPAVKGVDGGGNGLILVPGSHGSKPAFGIWLIDSNSRANAPPTIAGQPLGGDEWIHTNQVVWYYETSLRVERRLGHKLPSLMFFHVPLQEFRQMADRGPITGVRGEPECTSKMNSGMFAALLERGDVLGVYVGHDHYNSYEGNYYGIRLGYGGAVKFAKHRPDPAVEAAFNQTRGARVFVIDERDPSHYRSRFVHFSGLGRP